MKLKRIVFQDRIYKYCTKPELEILIIISENMYFQFIKSKKTPKSYALEFIEYNKEKYNQSTTFIDEYYGGKDIDILVKSIKEYKEIK